MNLPSVQFLPRILLYVSMNHNKERIGGSGPPIISHLALDLLTKEIIEKSSGLATIHSLNRMNTAERLAIARIRGHTYAAKNELTCKQ